MKKTVYQQPAMQLVALCHQQHLLAGSVIGPGEPNLPSGAPELDFEEQEPLFQESIL